MLRATALLLTVFTGFTGLVYEVTWQKYLATLLGSHSEATAAVLAIFLGGLSVGYSLFGRVTRRLVASAAAAGRPPRLLFVYGVVEAGIGVWALLFPVLFRGVQAISFRVPIESAGAAFGFDVLLSMLLIGPPTVLMGGTIPILTQALARSLDDATRFHAFVYAFNTAGAFAGALAAGFFLIPALGLVRILIAMGAINLAAGALFVGLGWRPRATFDDGDSQGAERIGGFALYAGVALLVGFAMMSIQTVLIRIAGLSLGASHFTFSTVVAVFVLCIALGSFAVSALPRIGPGLVVGNHWLLALLAGLLYLRLDEGPYWAHALRSLFRDELAAFYPYYLSFFVLLLAVTGLPVLLSGASLPLLFHQLRREAGELGAVAGRLYSWNTVGSLLGALLGGYALLFWLDLHQLYRIAIAALALAAVLLTARLLPLPERLRVLGLRPALAVALAVPLLLGLAWLPPWMPEMLSSGVFRQRTPVAITWQGPDAFRERVASVLDFPFHDDDPTSTVVVREAHEGGRMSRSIITNGKSDGSTLGDYTTMALAAIVPALLAERTERSFVIGYGTGVTAGELAALPEMQEVLVAEISPAVIEAAPLFDFASLGASEHPKVEIVRSDAYRALLRSDGEFDVIVSEPSNPWVTGVEMLFSREFLEVARERLAPGGVYAQWFHQYETSDETIAMVLRTYASVFGRVAVWYAQGPDLLLLGFEDDGDEIDLERLETRVREPAYREALQRSKIRGLPELLAHELMPRGVVNAAGLEGPIHTLLHPRLNHEAGRAFFRGSLGTLPFTGGAEAAAIGREQSLVRRFAERHAADLPEDFRGRVADEACRQRVWQCAALLASWFHDDPDDEMLARQLAQLRRRSPILGRPLARQTAEQLSFLFDAERLPEDNDYGPELAEKATRAYQQFYHHGAPFDPQALLAYWQRCRGTAAEAERCRAGLVRARALVEGGAALPEPVRDILPDLDRAAALN